MATTVAQHTVATFTSPVNGTTPIDANTVRGNDNTTRVAYNDHDSDPGIHVQSSTLASRPVAGTAGRKWITEDSGIYTLWFDDGTNWHPVSSENVAVTVLAGETLAKGDVVKITGWNNGQDLAEVVKTTSASDTAFAVMTAAVSSGTMGYATNTGIVQDVNTAAYSVGTILYANGSGGFTSTKPTSGNYQPCAFVLRSNVNNGVYYVEFSAPRIVERSDNTASTVVLRDASGNFSAGTITATAVNATTLDLTNLEVTNIKAKDGTQAIAIADVTGVTTFSAVVGATLSTAAQPNITSVGTLSSLAVGGDLTVDTSTLKVDSTNNRVGVGTASPATALHVYSPTATTLRVDNNDNAAAQTIALATGGTNRATFSIATSSSDLVIKSEDAGGRSNGIQFWTGNASAERMTIAANGNLAVDTNTLFVDAVNNRVGVGTASPSTALQVYDATSATIRATSGASANLDLTATATDVRVGTPNGVSLLFRTSNATVGSFDSAGNLAVDTNTLYVDAVNNRVGVGTASPSQQVTIENSADIARLLLKYTGTNGSQQALFQVQNNLGNGLLVGTTSSAWTGGAGLSSNESYLWTIGAHALSFGTGTAEKMRLDASGNLGLGVTPSAWGLGKALEINNTGNAIWGVQAADLRLFANTRYDGTNYRYTNTGSSAARYDVNNGTLGGFAWYVAPSGTAGNAITFTQAMTLDASGNLSVSNAANGVRIGLFAGSARAVRFGADATTAYVEGVDQTGIGSYQPLFVNGSILQLATGATERVRVKAEGQMRFVPLAAAPTTNVENGDVYYDSTTNKLRVRAAGAWVDLH